jgi:hypothetical protein
MDSSALLLVSPAITSQPATTANQPVGKPRRRFSPLTVCVVVATLVFALAGIGSPLLGMTVFADTGSLSGYSGYRDVLAGVEVQTQYQRDLVDDQMPNEILFGTALRNGEFAAWNPYVLGGGPLGSTPNQAVASPLSLPYWVLPGWLAPAYEKLLELFVAIGGMVLFLRRLRLGRASAWIGGLVFGGSAFMVVWTGWPQTRVAALIPALFWAVESLAQRTRPREVALVALPVAGMLLGGFPAVAGYALVTAAIYLMARLSAERGRRFWRRWNDWQPILARVAAAGAGVVAGVGLVAWQLVPWAEYMRTVLLEGRDQDVSKIIPVSSLLTTIAPYALGTVSPAHLPNWFGDLQLIDAESYLGGAALILAVTSIALARTSRSQLPKGAWAAIVGTALGWFVVIYAGGPPLWLLQHASFLFSDNFVGRARSVLGFLMAALTAVGFEALLQRRRERAGAAERPPAPKWLLASTWLPRHDWLVADGARGARRVYAYSVWGVLALGGLAIYLFAGRPLAQAADDKRADGASTDLSFLNSKLLIGMAIVAVAAGCAAWLWFGPTPTDRRGRWLRRAAAGLLPLLIAGQSLAWVESYYPRTDKNDFYPATPTQGYLAGHVGHNRYYGADGAIFGSVDMTVGLRSFHGHGLLDQRFADLVETLPGPQFSVPATAIISNPAAGLAAMSPMLDRAAVSYYTAPPSVAPFGSIRYESSNGPAITLQPGQTVNTPIPVNGPLRGVGFTPEPLGDVPAAPVSVRIRVLDPGGHLIAQNERSDAEPNPGAAWIVPLAAEDVGVNATLTAQITVLGPEPLTIASHNGRPALTAVAAVNDGLRLVYAQETTIYQRTRALDRAHWASAIRVVPDVKQRVDMIASGTLKPNEVVLDAAAPAPSGQPATVNWVDDGLNEETLDVNAQGSGYLVLDDAIQSGWKVTVDGAPANLIAADHAFVAVNVPAGHHAVRFWYPLPWSGPGPWITGFTILLLLGCMGGHRWWTHRRPPVSRAA